MVRIENASNASYQAALQVAQQAVIRLANWLEMSFKFQSADLNSAVNRAMKILSWENAEVGALRVVFDRINLTQEKRQEDTHYYPAIAIDSFEPSIPYPQTQIPDLSELKTKIKLELAKLDAADWSNLSLLSLILEKYGSCLSFGDKDVALVDRVRITGAVAAALAQSSDPEQVKELSLVSGDLSGIQKFIYTISSEGALKSLRARSFYLELVTEEIIQQFLERLQLPRTSIIYSGGGKFYLIAPVTSQVKEDVVEMTDRFNKWLSHEFQNKIFLATACQPFEISTVNNKDFIEAAWNPVIKSLSEQKNRKFNAQLSELLKQRTSYEPCKVCHRDDQRRLFPLNKYAVGSVSACFTCCSMFRLGEQIFRANVIVRSQKRRLSSKRIRMKTPTGAIYYNLYNEDETIPKLEREEQVFWINNWIIENYCQQSAVSLLLGNYGRASEETSADEGQGVGFMRAGEFAQKATGINRVGYLRMDVDRLGQIFAKGLGEHYSLPRLAGLSRQMSYFFKVYLNRLAGYRKENFLSHKDKLGFESLTDGDRPNLLFIYAGGDDLFVSGAWNEVVEFAFDVYQSFRAYTGNNPDITLSSGISIDDIKFPLYQSAELSKDLEDLAKGNDRDSLGLFGKAFKWNQWLGATESQAVEKLINELDDKGKEHLDIKDKPDWLGILPFVRSLYVEQGTYSRSFVRNLLVTAELQDQAMLEKQKQIEQIKKKQTDTHNASEVVKLEKDQQEIRYYLHLPKIAYTLARLPDRLCKPDPISGKDSFKPIRTSLKNPYNAPYFRAIATWIELLTRNASRS